MYAMSSPTRIAKPTFNGLAALLATACLLVSPLTLAVDATTAKQAHEAYTKVINSNNVASFMTMVTDDVVMLSPNEPAVVGKKAVRAWVTGYYQAFTAHWDKRVVSFAEAGDWAYEMYSYKQSDKPKAGGDLITDTGKGLIVYHRDADGKWRVAKDAWNSDLAAAH